MITDEQAIRSLCAALAAYQEKVDELQAENTELAEREAAAVSSAHACSEKIGLVLAALDNNASLSAIRSIVEG